MQNTRTYNDDTVWLHQNQSDKDQICKNVSHKTNIYTDIHTYRIHVHTKMMMTGYIRMKATETSYAKDTLQKAHIHTDIHT